MLNKDILIYLYNGLTQYDHALIGKIRQTCKLFSYYPRGIVKVTHKRDAVYYTLLVNGEAILHRGTGIHPWTDGPAIEWADGDKEWFVHGKRHRSQGMDPLTDGPAVEWMDRYKEWWIRGKLHREDGPAIEWANGQKEWFVHGERHREDGPAVERANGDKSWWIRGKKYSGSDFNVELKRLSC